MADAPAGGGNKLAGAEILILVVLGLGALAVLSGNPLTPIQSTTRPATRTSTAAKTPKCGIVLSRPKSNESVTNIITLVGTVTPCDNSPLLDNVLTAQVVDKTGAPMSDLTRITMASATATSASFSGSVPVTGNPLPGTGYVIVTGPVRYDGTSLTARTAIKF